ncbi:MAG TPA: nucleotide sugar dehydrogenase, partial [Nitrosopumilaceae archaeon]|nr:nucleotide sugar dehydrogenase [Nitrosopumilaceae archaeon]
GQVGLPTALTFCKSGFDVIGHDINEKLLSTLNSKKLPFEEDDLDDLLKSSINKDKFHINNNLAESVKNSDVIIICVATPLTNGVRPDLSALENVCKSLSGLSLANKLVIIESSIPPGTFAGYVMPSLGTKYRIGSDFWAAFVPERLAPGQALSEIQTTPRVIGYVDEDSGLLAKTLYEKIVKSQIFLTTAQIAEISKLVENTFRDVNVAFANEVGMICEKYGVDVAELIRVCNSHPRVKLLQPGPGVGGPCLPKDPYLLLNPQGNSQIDSKIILESRKINDSMPYHVVNLVTDALKAQNKKIAESTILVLGIAYKGNVSDTRFSPAKEIISYLLKDGCKVLVFDPKTEESFGGQKITDIQNVISSCDAMIVVTDHNEFKKLDLKMIQKMKKTPILVDTRRIFQRKEVEDLGIHYLSIGYKKPQT